MSKQRFTKPIICKHCSNKAPMLIMADCNRIRTYTHEGSPIPWDEGPIWEVLECPSCKDVLFRKGYWHDSRSELETGIEFEILYPTVPESIRGLPSQIASSFEAAQKVKSVDSNAFAVLLGRVLDFVCIDKKAEGASLFERLKDIADKGIIPQQLADMSHQLRQLRNIGAHADLGELTETEVPILESLIKAILEYVYSAPALVQLVQAKIDAIKTKKP